MIDMALYADATERNAWLRILSMLRPLSVDEAHWCWIKLCQAYADLAVRQ